MVPIVIAIAAAAGALSRYGLERLIPGAAQTVCTTARR